MAARRRVLLGGGIAVAVGLGVLAWVLWREPGPPPPSTAQQLYAAVMRADPAELSDEERDKWIARVGSTFNRLPAHELEKVVQKAMSDDSLRERFRSLKPEQRRKMGELISQEQRLEMMLRMIEVLKKLPAPVRRAMVEQARERMKKRGDHRNITKEQIAQRLGSTTPTQRAKFARAMRELREMLKERDTSD